MRTKRNDHRAHPGRKRLTAVAVAALLLAAVAAHADGDAEYYVREITGEASGPFRPGQVVEVESTGGSITITAWDRDSVDVKATLEAINIDDRNRELTDEKARAEHTSTELETRARDLTVAARSYAMAANLGRHAGLNDVWSKLARHTPQYVHILQTLSRRHLGLGARLDDTALARLLQG